MKFSVITAVICLHTFAAAAEAQPQQQVQSQHSDKPQIVTNNQTAATSSSKVKAFNNTMCPVSDEPIPADGGKKVVHKGYEISLCCGGCVKEFKKNPDDYLDAMLKAEKAKASKDEATAGNPKPVNNATCPVSSHPVGSMQPGSNIVYKGYKIGLCCDGCIGRFNQNADAYLEELLKPKS